jgi:hypothetical protein
MRVRAFVPGLPPAATSPLPPPPPPHSPRQATNLLTSSLIRPEDVRVAQELISTLTDAAGSLADLVCADKAAGVRRQFRAAGGALGPGAVLCVEQLAVGLGGAAPTPATVVLLTDRVVVLADASSPGVVVHLAGCAVLDGASEDEVVLVRRVAAVTGGDDVAGGDGGGGEDQQLPPMTMVLAGDGLQDMPGWKVCVYTCRLEGMRVAGRAGGGTMWWWGPLRAHPHPGPDSGRRSPAASPCNARTCVCASGSNLNVFFITFACTRLRASCARRVCA